MTVDLLGIPRSGTTVVQRILEDQLGLDVREGGPCQRKHALPYHVGNADLRRRPGIVVVKRPDAWLVSWWDAFREATGDPYVTFGRLCVEGWVRQWTAMARLYIDLPYQFDNWRVLRHGDLIRDPTKALTDAIATPLVSLGADGHLPLDLPDEHPSPYGSKTVFDPAYYTEQRWLDHLDGHFIPDAREVLEDWFALPDHADLLTDYGWDPRDIPPSPTGSGTASGSQGQRAP